MSQVVATGATVRASDLSGEPERLPSQREMQGFTSSLELGQSGRYDLSGKKDVRIRAFSQADWAWTRSSTDRLLPPPDHAPVWEAHSGDPALAWTGRCGGFRNPSGGAPPDGHLPLESAG